LHNAVMERILDPMSVSAQSFVTWFRAVFQV
jgi:hypothetical protein